MRILIAATAARMGGARSHVLGFVPELAHLAPQDEVLLLAQPDLAAELPPLPPSWTVRTDVGRSRGAVGQLIWEQRVLPRIVRTFRADVLLSFGSFVPLRAGCATVLEAGNALQFTTAYWRLMCRAPAHVQLREVLRWLLLRESLRSATRILAPTRAMRQDVITRLPEVAHKVDVAVWGVAEHFHRVRWSEPRAERTVLGVSKHGINKEFDLLVRAAPHLNADVMLTGTPDESPWSRRSAALARQLGVTDRVCFVGDVPNRSVPDLVLKAQVLVFPTWCESFGLPLAEALAMGAPAVAANIPACREVGGEAARYYTPGDAGSLREAIGGLLDDRAAAQSLAVAAYERGQRFHWRANAEAVYATLQRAVATYWHGGAPR